MNVVSIKPSAKAFFFDRAAVMKAVDRANRQALNRAGATVRKAAIFSIKDRAPGTYSKPGSPPYSHVGHRRRMANRKRKAAGQARLTGGFKGVKHIFYVYQPDKGSVIAGPTSNRSGFVTHTLEFGGSVRSRKRTVNHAARPFMRPALERTAPALAALWKNSIVRN